MLLLLFFKNNFVYLVTSAWTNVAFWPLLRSRASSSCDRRSDVSLWDSEKTQTFVWGGCELTAQTQLHTTNLARGSAPTAEDNGSSIVSKDFDKLLANARCGAGDDRNLALERWRWCVWCWWSHCVLIEKVLWLLLLLVCCCCCAAVLLLVALARREEKMNLSSTRCSFCTGLCAHNVPVTPAWRATRVELGSCDKK